MKIIIGIVLLASLQPAMSYGEEKHHQNGNNITVGVEALSGDLRSLLSQEMQALQGGMMAIIPAYASGNWNEIETIARSMKNSYILEQRLTKSQEEELHSVLPPAFIEEDERFHYLAGMLEQVAKKKNVELINFYFSKMNESCVSCHRTFASHKFPALLLIKHESEHAH